MLFVYKRLLKTRTDVRAFREDYRIAYSLDLYHKILKTPEERRLLC